MNRVLGCLLAALLAATLAAPAAADAAKPSRKKAMWGPVRVDGVSQFPIYRELGVGIYQYAVSWADVAPSRPADPRNPADPAYRWPEELDFAVEQARRYGMQVSIMLIRTPEWANGGKPSNFVPIEDADFANFAEAAARRYGTVRHWMIWGEPIRYPNFFLHYKNRRQQRTNGALTRLQRRDVRKYATMLDAAYGRLKAVNRRNLVIGGNTTTIGDFYGPLNWIKHLRLPNGKPPRMDLYGHNPFGTRTPDLRKRQLLPGTADFSDLDVLAGWLDRYLARRGRNRKLPIFISEYTAPTDVESYEFNYHVTRRVQARWLAAAFRITRRWPRIYTLGWIGLRDTGTRQKGKESRTGLIDAQGRRKPAFRAYQRG